MKQICDAHAIILVVDEHSFGIGSVNHQLGHFPVTALIRQHLFFGDAKELGNQRELIIGDHIQAGSGGLFIDVARDGVVRTAEQGYEETVGEGTLTQAVPHIRQRLRGIGVVIKGFQASVGGPNKND